MIQPKKKSCPESFFKAISIGQYHTKLYNNGETTYSSIGGGLVSLVYVLAFLTYASFQLYDCFNHTNIIVSKSEKVDTDLTWASFYESFKPPVFYISDNGVDLSKECGKMEICIDNMGDVFECYFM